MSEVTGVIVITRETDNFINVKSRYFRDSHRHERLARVSWQLNCDLTCIYLSLLCP